MREKIVTTVIKRNGESVEFYKVKIKSAISNAFIEIDGKLDDKSNEIINRISDSIEGLNKDLNVEEIQDIIENKLMSSSRKDVAKAFMLFREKRKMVREALKRDEGILSLIKGTNDELNVENSNKNATLVTTQRDYIAGEVSKDLVRRYNFFPKEVIEAHDEGLIHLSDLDYQIQPIHNCFDLNTKFVTENGLKSFSDFKNGDIVSVLSLDGKYHKSIVKNYGKQPIYKYTFYSGKKEHTYEVLATENHRWILNDGTHTTNLSVGDKLIKAPSIFEKDLDFNSLNESEKLMWCKGFALGDGTVEFKHKNKKSNNTRIRLCGDKNKFINRFDGTKNCAIRGYVYGNGDREVVINDYKKDIPKFCSINEMKCFFNGLYSADGRTKIPKKSNRINYCLQSSDRSVIDFIRKYADSVGLYITKENDLTGEVTNLTDKNGRKYTILFSFNPNFYFNYTVLKKEFVKYDEVWCLNVKDTHNFILEHGIPTGNCELINLEDMLQNGTVINGVKIDKPNSFSTACTIATQIIVQVTSNSYGGATISLSHLSPFIQSTREKLTQEWGDKLSKEDIEKLVHKDIKDGIQTIQYQLITISGTNGQSAFLSLFLYINEVEEGQGKKDLAMAIEEVLRQRILGVKNEKGAYITTAFPKLLYVLDENNITEDSEYWYLTKLSAECTTKRLVPDYISAKKMRELKGGNVFPCMGCRSFLQEYYINNIPKFYGRFNQGVCSVNLVDIALSSKKDMKLFWEIMDERLELAYKGLMSKHNNLKGTKAKVAPILWQYGALARLKPEDTIDKLLYDDYSSISLAYSGIHETVSYMTGLNHTDGIGMDFGKQILKHMNDKCKEWKEKTRIGFSVYGVPQESLTLKFAKAIQKRHGVIEGISDKNYIMNSYHVNIKEKIDAFTKLKIEGEYQPLSLGGAISYVETPNMTHNVDAVLEVIKFIYDTIMYAEINTQTSYCHDCGGSNIKMEKDLKFHCQDCGNDNFERMNVATRVCGYISTNAFNEGRAEDIYNRVYHLGCD